MDRAPKFAAAILLSVLQVPVAFCGEPAPANAPAAVVSPKAAPVVPPAINVTRTGGQTQIEIAAPAGQIQAQVAPGNSRLRATDRRGLTVELSQPPVGAPGEEPPQLKDLLLKSLFQTLATHRSVRMGKFQIDIQTAPQSAPATAVPDSQLDLGAPGSPEDEDSQSAAPAAPAKVQVPRAAGDASQRSPAPPAPLAAPEQALPVEALPAPKQEVRRQVRPQIIPVQASEVAPNEPVFPRAVPQAAPAALPAAVPNAAASDLEAVQKELARLTADLQELSRKRSVKGKSLQDMVRRIGETNLHLEAARKKLAP